MTYPDILEDLETLYKNFQESGNTIKAQETLLEISRLKTQLEGVKQETKNILLG